MEPMVRIIVLNYNGGDHVVECIESLAALDWPPRRRELVVVDNASHDGSPERIAGLGHEIRLIRNRVNTGFSANNLALEDLDGVDFVALVNPDATVEPGWLRALVDGMTDDDLGATVPLMLLATRRVDVMLHAPPDLDVRLHDVDIDGESVVEATVRLWRLLQTDHGVPSRGSRVARLRNGTIPVAAGSGAEIGRLRLRLSADPAGTIRLGGDDVEVGPEPRWVEVTQRSDARDVVNNAGIELRRHGYGADRGLGDTALDRYREPVEVFGWSGGGVLLRVRYLRDVGLFDPLYFLYYEDLDLSWRGRARGWRYRFVPGAVMRHRHAASTVAGSPMFVFQTERNRLVTVISHAPVGFVLASLARFHLATLGYVRAEIVCPLLRGRPPDGAVTWQRLRVTADLLRSARLLRARRRMMDRRRTAARSEFCAWMVPPR